jgi:ketosteroid isomerase-like protein
MSEGNAEIVRRMFEAYLAGDAEQTLACFHPNVVADFRARGDTHRVQHGREALAELVAAWVGAWDDYSERLDEIRDLGDDKVLVIATQRGRGKGSGLELTTQYAQLYEVRDGQIATVALHTSPAKALEAAGLSD